MIPKSILFIWSKGSETRREILKFVDMRNKSKKPCFLNDMAKRLRLSHVAVKKHLDLLIDEKYIKPINPKGKPVYLELTNSGKEILKGFRK